MTEQHFQCLSDGEEEEQNDYILSPLTNNEGPNENGTIRKNLMADFGPAKKSVADEEPPGREHMKVYLRVRPFMEKELLSNENQGCIEIEDDKAVVMHAPRDSFAFKNSSRGVGETCHRFTFSRVFDPQTSQKNFFDSTALDMIKDFVDGQNCLVFTYGVTNSGKTYTIQGTAKDGGILPRSLDVLFNSINGKQYKRTNLKPKYFCDVVRLDDKQEHNEELVKKTYLQSLDKGNIDLSALLKLEDSDLSKTSSFEESSLHSSQGEHESDNTVTTDNENMNSDGRRVADETTISVDGQGPINFSVWVSFAEIYNEKIFDLLEPCPTGKGIKRKNLRLGDDKNGNPYIKGLREVCVNSADEAFKMLKVGQNNQSISATKLNQCSSRSHSIFSVKVLRVVSVENPHVARVSRLSFVDLAGSERYTKTQSKGDRLKEAGNINTSLMTLGKCLDYLRYNQNNPNQPLIIPFRESKLTRLFQGTFCGRGKACMIVNVNQCASTYDETCHAMKFSAIAKQVTTKITKPVDLAPPTKKVRGSSILGTPTTCGRMSVPWAKGAINTPVPKKFATVAEADEDGGSDGEADDGNHDCYQQQLIALVQALQEQLLAERKSKMQMEMKIREEVCAEMAEQFVAIENSYSERMHDEVLAVEERCDRRIELLTKSMKKSRKRVRVERFEDDEDEWVSSVLLHAEQARVTELQAKLNKAEAQIEELQQTLDDAGEAFAEKESEILKLKKALEADEKLRKEQDQALRELRGHAKSNKENGRVVTRSQSCQRNRAHMKTLL